MSMKDRTVQLHSIEIGGAISQQPQTNYLWDQSKKLRAVHVANGI